VKGKFMLDFKAYVRKKYYSSWIEQEKQYIRFSSAWAYLFRQTFERLSEKIQQPKEDNIFPLLQTFDSQSRESRDNSYRGIVDAVMALIPDSQKTYIPHNIDFIIANDIQTLLLAFEKHSESSSAEH
jgi:hypothetical protein